MSKPRFNFNDYVFLPPDEDNPSYCYIGKIIKSDTYRCQVECFIHSHKDYHEWFYTTSPHEESLIKISSGQIELLKVLYF